MCIDKPISRNSFKIVAVEPGEDQYSMSQQLAVGYLPPRGSQSMHHKVVETCKLALLQS